MLSITYSSAWAPVMHAWGPVALLRCASLVLPVTTLAARSQRVLLPGASLTARPTHKRPPPPHRYKNQLNTQSSQVAIWVAARCY